MELTSDQTFVFDQIIKRLGRINDPPKFHPNFDYLTIGGFAGTGKTFLISIIRKEIYNNWKKLKVAFVAFTGKASSVLRSKLNENESFFEDLDFCGTIHSLLYRPEFKYDNKSKKMVITRWIKKEDLYLYYDLVFVDESSMINKEIFNDLMSEGIPVIFVGDHGQLPPVGDEFNLMISPNYELKEIKRQSLENPIIRLSKDIREGRNIPYGFYDDNCKSVFKLEWNNKGCQNIFNNLNFRDENMIVLCGRNKTRVMLNQMIRDRLSYKLPEPYPGERVVCLQNNHYSKIMNGQLGSVNFLLHEGKDFYDMTIKIDNFKDYYSGLVYNGCFGKENYQDIMLDLYNNPKKRKNILKKSDYEKIDLFDFGYAISVHKSQGSEWDKVVLFQEKSYYWDDEYYRKWLYTACTRSKEKLFIIT